MVQEVEEFGRVEVEGVCQSGDKEEEEEEEEEEEKEEVRDGTWSNETVEEGTQKNDDTM